MNTMNLTPLYGWMLRHDVFAYRGGTKVFNALTAISPWAEVDGVSLDLRAMNWQVAQLVAGRAVEHEPEVHEVIRDRVRRDHVVLDIGANLGLHTLALSRVARTVHAFEPNPLLLPALRRTVSRLPNVVLHEHALGDHDGSVSLVSNEDHSTAHVTSGGTIPIRRLDDVVDGPVHFIKVDVEGHERAVFEGAPRILREYKPAIVFEEIPGGEPAARRHLETLGYRCEQIDDRDWLAQ
jgi:FkbM family methyltransferase